MILSLAGFVVGFFVFLALASAMCRAADRGDHIAKWQRYNAARHGSYEFRSSTRYKAVADKLFALGLRDGQSVLDVGAGSCQFGRYLRERGWHGVYIPVDAVIDGANLETWSPLGFAADYVVCIETVEHVRNPARLMLNCYLASARALVVTTPNPDAVDVLRCDPTHRSAMSSSDFLKRGYCVEWYSWFGVPNDSLLAWRRYA